MNRKSIVITCLLTVSALICAGTVKAQNCETSEPVFYVGFISTLDNDAVGKSLECLNRTVSITAHYVVISPGDTIPVADTIIDTLLYKINQLFEPICLSFQICTEQMVPRDDYFFLNDSAGYQYQDVMVVEYNVPKTLNIYFIDHFLMDTAKCGYATLPVIPCQEEEGYIVIKYGCLKDLTLAHLIGNYLGLLHTAQFSGELVNGSNCATAGDRICDTDADPYHYYAPHDTLCNYTGIAVDANEDHYAPPVSNIMSEFRGCRCRFTFQQYYRMVQVFHQCREFLW